MSAISIGLDDGYAYTKIALPDGRVLAVPSRGRLGRAKVTWLDERTPRIREYETGACVYAAGEVDGESTQFDEYPYSGLNRVIVQHALQEAGLGGHALHAISGLPVDAFYLKNGGRRSDTVAKKCASLKQGVQPTDGRLAADLAFHDVIPEALASWYDYVITETADGVQLDAERLSAPIAVIDIGGRTTDYVVVADQAVHHASSGSLRCGLLDVTQAIEAALRTRFDLEEIGERLVAEAVQQGSVRLFGKPHDVSELLRAALHEVVARIHAETRRQLGRGAELERVLFVGGGTVVLAEHLRDWFPNQVIAALPAFANARGMLKYLQYVCQVPEA